MKPQVFIGSSVEALDVAYAIQQNLEHSAEVTVWDQNVFELSQYSLESLLSIVKKIDFGIFVFAPDDLGKIRDVTSRLVRDNVLFELGLFCGHLGRDRCFMVKPAVGFDFHLPTDLLGIKVAEYDPQREDQNLRAALGPATNNMRRVIGSLGKAYVEEERFINETILRHFPPTTKSRQLEGLWLSRFSYTAKRGGKAALGFQYDLELLTAAGTRSLLGANLLCGSSSGKQYWHELRAQVLSDYLLGSWFNVNTKNLGAFQLHIHTHSCVMSGTHIGNDNDNAVPHGEWIWLKVETDLNRIENLRTELKTRQLKSVTDLDRNFELLVKAAVPLKLEGILA